MRQAEITRKTAETDITLVLNLDGKGNSKIDTGCGFMNHTFCKARKFRPRSFVQG